MSDPNIYWHAYELWVDGLLTNIELIGTSKANAYKMLPDQWWIDHKAIPPPVKRRCKLVRIETVRNG